jgi:hypothetical protein
MTGIRTLSLVLALCGATCWGINCDQYIYLYGTDTDYIFSPNYPSNYPNDANCTFTISNQAYPSKSILFTFIYFHTESNYDELVVTPTGGQSTTPAQTFSGTIASNKTAFFIAPKVTAVFKSDFSYSYQGFKIKLSLIPTPFLCPMGQFKCQTQKKCIPLNQRCDGVAQCNDQSDELDNWCKMNGQCGTQAIQPNITFHEPRMIPVDFIVNGTVAMAGSWPWMVSLHTNSGFQFCGGSLIAPHWVVTAAHCVKNHLDPAYYTVHVGSFHVASYDAPYETDVGVTAVRMHPDYNGNTNSFDIALLRLAKDVPFPFNSHVNAVCLPNQYGYVVPSGTLCVTTGWGVTHGTGSDAILRQVVLPVVSNSVCNADYNGQVDNTMICAGYPLGGKDSCQGDSGGPFVCQDPSSKRWIMQGVVSWGRGCGEPGYPGVYSRTSVLTDFVYQTTAYYDGNYGNNMP